MTEAWKQWEGQVVNGEFYLHEYLGGCETRAVFRTEYGERERQKAAIKLIPAHPENTELQLCLIGLAAKLSHPHLIRLFQIGRCQLGSMELVYVVMEYAEENLSQVLPQRPLTPVEAREMLEPILDSLAFVHGQGFAHGHIKPANVMGVKNRLKLSSDGLCRTVESRGDVGKPGVYDAPEIARGEISPAADVWSLGMTLVEALTQKLPVWNGSEQEEPVLPESLPAPFLELARHCLQRDVQRRWRLADIVAHMRQTSASQVQTSANPQAVFAKGRYVAPVVALGLLLAAMLVGPRLFNRHPDAQPIPSTVVEQPVGQPEPAQKQVTPEAGLFTKSPGAKKQGVPASPRQTPAHAEAGRSTPTVGVVPSEVVHQVLPDVPRKARGTIRGQVRVAVRVRVDPSGRVVAAKLDSAGPSRYFADLALKAAWRWKFTPAKLDGRNVSKDWILRFEFGRTATRVVPVRTAP